MRRFRLGSVNQWRIRVKGPSQQDSVLEPIRTKFCVRADVRGIEHRETRVGLPYRSAATACVIGSRLASANCTCPQIRAPSTHFPLRGSQTKHSARGGERGRSANASFVRQRQRRRLVTQHIRHRRLRNAEVACDLGAADDVRSGG